jgi:hypothetical protein
VWHVLQPAEPVKTALPAGAEVPELELELELPVDGLAPLEVDPEVEVDPEGVTPTGGGPLLGCLESHDWNAEGVTTRT